MRGVRRASGLRCSCGSPSAKVAVSALAIVIAVFALSGCTLVTGDSGDERLIRHRAMSGYPAALLAGVLREEGPCLVVEVREGERIVVVWPPRNSLGSDGGRTAVVDWLGRSRWAVGDHGQIGGGELTADAIGEFLVAPMPPDCARRSRYWLTGP